MSRRRVVVTGFGLLSPLGNSVAESWEKARNGISGIHSIESWDVSAFSTRFAGTIRDFDIAEYMEPKEARKCDP
ncbi:MAG TPA: beta-ketoacyl synthase N-terminal-like domain-containing protein, partial [Gammaproteobacteria bacterium]|nr:beta-ketoacyl synthase N-terminal-like domain-containing protein [Gammaproteobacteria bacterium]